MLPWPPVPVLSSFPWSQAAVREQLRRRCTALRYQAEGLRHVPPQGPLLLVLNHTGWEEILLLLLCFPRPLRFVAMREVVNLDRWASWQRLFTTRHFVHMPLLRRALFLALGQLIGGPVRAQMQAGGVIPVHIADEGVPPRFGKNGVGVMLTALANGEVVVLFPEAGLQRDGVMYPFRPGIGLLLRLLHRRGCDVLVLVAAQRSAGAIAWGFGNRYIPQLYFSPPVRVAVDAQPVFERRATRAIQNRLNALLPRVFPTVPRQTYAALDYFPASIVLPELQEIGGGLPL